METGPSFVTKALVMMKLNVLVNNWATQDTALTLLYPMYMGKSSYVYM